MTWVLANFNADGGCVFRRHEEFLYGHEQMLAHTDQSCMFPTWFRSLSLAYLARVFSEQPIGRVGWNFLQSPGYQFWNRSIQ